ncbi:hypothetical protein HDU87_003092 [Geranomyces variabilis]|uniref:Uncharacterized protein n=1 Tax=Geranomyces variabilis TaxID=109894 RepID=A0AAD5TKC7_9FUNG|nr:hypothetical protein HDU87_003092 [Geranomyces variabilis]
MLSEQDAQATEQQQQQPHDAAPAAPAKAGPPKPVFPSKHPLGKFQKTGGQFRSPTDNLMSPATKKVEAKRNHLLSKIKPKSLASDLSAAAESEQRKQ